MEPVIWRELAIFAASLVGVWLLARLVEAIWRLLFARLTRAERLAWARPLFEALDRPLYHLLLIAGLWLPFARLQAVTAWQGTWAMRAVEGAFFALAALAVARAADAVLSVLLHNYLRRAASRTKTDIDDMFIGLGGRVLRLVVYFLAVTVILAHFNVNITGFIATAGVASLAIAFAAQETLANMISGFVILLDRPFRVGDRIQLPDGVVGDVLEIGLRSTRILTFDNTLIVVPNKDLAGSRLVNHSYPDDHMALRTQVGIAYGSDIQLAKQVILDVCQQHPKVLKDPPPQVYFTEFGESALKLLVVCQVRDYRERFSVLDEINTGIYQRLREAGIQIPFPQRDVHLFYHGPAGPAAGAPAAGGGARAGVPPWPGADGPTGPGGQAG